MTENTNPELYAIDPMSGDLASYDLASMFRPVYWTPDDMEANAQMIHEIRDAIERRSRGMAIGHRGHGKGGSAACGHQVRLLALSSWWMVGDSGNGRGNPFSGCREIKR